jgi:hypothetical protein
LTDEIHTHVAINFTGEPDAVKFGTAMAQHPLETVEISCRQVSTGSLYGRCISSPVRGGSPGIRYSARQSRENRYTCRHSYHVAQGRNHILRC